MSETPDGKQPPKPKGLKLEDLLPNKASVETTVGTLYVRHARVSDWKNFDSNDEPTLGMAALRQLCNRIEHKKDSSPLDERDLEALVDSDIRALVPIVAKQSGWGELPSGAGCAELGAAMKAAKTQELERHKKMLADMRTSLASSYGFLGTSELEKLQQQMSGLASLRSAMSGTEAMQAAMRASGVLGSSLKDALAENSALESAKRALYDQPHKGLFATPTPIESPAIYIPPSFEETPLGRATQQTLESSREAVQKMDALVDVVAGLNQLVIKDVLPAWGKKISEDQKGAKDAFDQAADGLKWTKRAVWASVLVTVLATWWQVHVTQEIDRQNSEQQKRVEELMRVQLDVQQKLLDQQARDAKMLAERQASDAASIREAITRQKPATHPVAADKSRQ